MESNEHKIKRKPEWLKIHLPKTNTLKHVNGLVINSGLHTICESGNCPNAAECWERGTATFMILGDICTRACKFCNVATGKPQPVDSFEPEKLASTIKKLGLRHCVITSVDRDDLPDYGAQAWVNTILAIKNADKKITIETLIPDFNGKKLLIDKIINAAPQVISHNLETVERITPLVRSRAEYLRSLTVIEQIAKSGLVAKSGIMLGLGETTDEVLKTMDDLRNAGCKVLTIGQYLQPTRKHYPVADYIEPQKFDWYKTQGLNKGFSFVESAPLVRSSYKADNHVNA